MAFTEIRFPEDISYGSSGGPQFSTDVVMTHSGYEQRNINWANARAKYNVAHGVKTQNQLDQLVAFFRARKGRAIGFRFKDWSDYSAAGEIIGVGDNSTTVFQLIKTYSSDADSEIRSITKPVSGTVNIYVDSVLQESGVTISTSLGTVTFDSAPATDEVISADFEFDVPVRFDADRIATTLDAYSSFSVQDIPLVEVRI